MPALRRQLTIAGAQANGQRIVAVDPFQQPRGAQWAAWPRGSIASMLPIPTLGERMGAGSVYRPVAVDLFCGVGGLTLGLQRAGIRVVAGYDADPSCQYAYETNSGATFVCKRIEETTGTEVSAHFPRDAVRVLVGCAPCQPFSSYSSSTRRQESWQLLKQFATMIEQVQPDVVTMENVTRLRSFNRGTLFTDFVGRLARRYYVTSYSVSCLRYGVPQTRRRLVLFASRFGPVALTMATHRSESPPTVRQAIGRLPLLEQGRCHPSDPLHRSQALSRKNLARMRASRPGGSWTEWPDELRAECHKRDTGRTYRNVYGRMEWDRPAPTITTGCFNFGRGRFGHPSQDRAISLREAALLQTFPEDFEFSRPDQEISFERVGRHVGNAVPVALGEAVGRSIVEHLREVCA